MHIFILSSILFLLIIQGGYYASAFLVAGIAGSIVFIVTKRKIMLTYELCGLFIIALFYLLSTIINGISFSTLCQAMLPLVGLVFYGIAQSLQSDEKEKILSGLEVIGLLSSVVGILCFLGLINITGGMNVGRLQFTFQYANAASTWFAVCFILMRDAKRKWIQIASPIALVALLCTKSVGAILVLLVLQVVWFVRLLKQKKSKNLYVIAGLCAIVLIGCVVVFADRLGRAPYTFIERLIQTYDGLRVMFKNPFGIGPGNWQYVYPFYQSAQYDASVIHNSYVQVGVDAGIIAFLIMLLFLLYMIVRFLKRKNTITEAIVFILLHSTMEYNLFFACIGIFLLALVGMQEKEMSRMKSWQVASKVKVIIGIVCLGLFCFSFYGDQQLKENNQKIPDLLKCGFKESTMYVEWLFLNEQYVETIEFVDQGKNITSEMIELKMMAENELQQLTVDEAISAIKKQPYNKQFINQMSIYISGNMFSVEEIERYNQEIEHINTQIKQRPSCWLNNQEDVEYAKKN